MNKSKGTISRKGSNLFNDTNATDDDDNNFLYDDFSSYRKSDGSSISLSDLDSSFSDDYDTENDNEYGNEEEVTQIETVPTDNHHTNNTTDRNVLVHRSSAAITRLEDSQNEDGDEEITSSTFIMNQKTLVDKAPGSQQHSFAHRTIPLPNAFHIRMFQFSSIILISLFTAGIPFGLPAIRQLLLEAGIYESFCETKTSSAEWKRVGCSAQEARFSILQNTGLIAWMIAGWLAARSVQRYGPRTTAIIGNSLILIGSLILAASLPIDGVFLIPSWLRMYIFPVIIMSIGSSFSFLACLHYVRLFPKRTSLFHSVLFLSQELSALVFYFMYEWRKLIPLRIFLLLYACIIFGQIFFWRFVFSSEKIPTIRFTVTTWHQRPLLVDRSLPEHIASPYFYLVLILTTIVFLKIYFYMSTFQVQLRILLTPTKRRIDPEDFAYRNAENYMDSENDGGSASINSNNNTSSTPQFISQVPFFAEQPGGTSSNDVSLRQFTFNPMQPEIFFSDLQDMLYLLIPVASLMTIFWMRSSMSERKISTSFFLSLIPLIVWGFVQNIFSVQSQASAAMIFPIFRSIFTNGIYEYCERIFGCQHFHFTFWFLWATAGLIIALLLLPVSYFAINFFGQYSGVFENINGIMNILLILSTFMFIWILKCNKL